ncbi:hypothetical protein [Rhodocyclus gracilis]|uniref:Uncharacterized protein n=1 Tax=Rhodocyclus tenuis TaxID=1066 RepID=A0A6L5JUW3_RHOTE|nr:hypothetical protein [Rhodocyclus gracilis]MQY50841.1 hypothetical protein [Rhodocyclus gracilis]
MTADQCVQKAVAEWEKAPVHIRLVAAQYMEPVLAALVALNREVKELQHGK